MKLLKKNKINCVLHFSIGILCPLLSLRLVKPVPGSLMFLPNKLLFIYIELYWCVGIFKNRSLMFFVYSTCTVLFNFIEKLPMFSHKKKIADAISAASNFHSSISVILDFIFIFISVFQTSQAFLWIIMIVKSILPSSLKIPSAL